MKINGVIHNVHLGYSYDHYIIMIENDNGFKIDLASRLNEGAVNCGTQIRLEYGIFDTKQKQKINEDTKKINGLLEIFVESFTSQISEYIEETQTRTMIYVGDHGLHSEISNHEGKYLSLDAEFYKTTNS